MEKNIQKWFTREIKSPSSSDIDTDSIPERDDAKSGNVFPIPGKAVGTISSFMWSDFSDVSGSLPTSLSNQFMPSVFFFIQVNYSSSEQFRKERRQDLIKEPRLWMCPRFGVFSCKEEKPSSSPQVVHCRVTITEEKHEPDK